MSENNETNTLQGDDIKINRQLLHSVVRLNTLLMATVSGVIGGLSLFLITYLSLFRGLPEPGHYLNLLGIFLPGYKVSLSGAWIGLFWGAVIGAFLGGMFYRVYARSIESQVRRCIERNRVGGDLMQTTLRMSGKHLGLALGGVVSIGLVITTNWLVIRGTADESMNAMLLSNYLPGYTVSFWGSIVGGVQLFFITYIICLIFSWLYNVVAFSRGGHSCE